jgi:hypothetical protein
MDAAADGTLYVSYSAGGTYRLASGSGATFISANIASALAAVNFQNAYMSFYTGTFKWNNVAGTDLITTTSTTGLRM